MFQDQMRVLLRTEKCAFGYFCGEVADGDGASFADHAGLEAGGVGGKDRVSSLEAGSIFSGSLGKVVETGCG